MPRGVFALAERFQVDIHTQYSADDVLTCVLIHEVIAFQTKLPQKHRVASLVMFIGHEGSVHDKCRHESDPILDLRRCEDILRFEEYAMLDDTGNVPEDILADKFPRGER
ncbi:transposase IS605 [Perkinsela sp. CCAP 1560/4]|nr:transposase IS605 [Perkinsela sp. CCAP 1560/4]|eukprot:KNH05342.1 transposase IS605 [Perkinsela sp. CCAP 1560/4]